MSRRTQNSPHPADVRRPAARQPRSGAGLIWFAQVSAAGGTYLGDILFPSLLAAVGLGFAFVPVTIASVTCTRPNEAGLASVEHSEAAKREAAPEPVTA